MISASLKASPQNVAEHYDHLDRFYRDIWGEHVHHGFWETGKESPEEAVLLLSHKMAQLARIQPGSRVCDVGCGYGGTSRILAREYGAEVDGFTVSKEQYKFAKSQTRVGESLRFHCVDFLKNEMPDESFDSLISIECIEHIEDKKAFFQSAYRILKPGARFALAVWTASDQSSPWQNKTLLQPICDEGRMPDLMTASEWRKLIEESGLVLDHQQDVADQVKKTWRICCQRLARRLVTDSSVRKFLWNDPAKDKVFALTLFRLCLAFETKAMRYWIYSGVKA